jgi:4'-phosphopantetheinyl transferase EntD
MRRSARFTAGMVAKVQAQVGAMREHLQGAQRELQRARNAAVMAISTAVAAGADPEDLEKLRGAKEVLDGSLAGEELQQLEAAVERVLPRTPAG